MVRTHPDGHQCRRDRRLAHTARLAGRCRAVGSHAPRRVTGLTPAHETAYEPSPLGDTKSSGRSARWRRASTPHSQRHHSIACHKHRHVVAVAPVGAQPSGRHRARWKEIARGIMMDAPRPRTIPLCCATPALILERRPAHQESRWHHRPSGLLKETGPAQPA